MKHKETGSHSFEIDVATWFKSIEKALLYKEISRMVLYKARNNKSPWVYYSANALSEKFPYLNARSIERWMKEIVDAGELVTAVKNKAKYDKTKSYTLPQFAEWNPQDEESNPLKGEPIPPLSTPLSNSSSYFSKEKSEVSDKDDEITFSPTNEEGDEVGPKKRKETWTREKEVEQLFAVECSKRNLPKPSKVPSYMLRVIRKGLKEVTDVQALFDFWFDTAMDEHILNVHSCFAAGSINRFKANKAKKKPKVNEKYNNIKVTKTNNENT